jgi:methionyl-tRNA formyltransferase
MRLVFMGTPTFAVPVIEALASNGHKILGIFTQPDKARSRGLKSLPTATKEFGVRAGIPVFESASVKGESALASLRALAPDAIVVAAYGNFIPREFFSLPPLGAINIHPSLLPRHRGPSPVSTAILEDDESTGVTVYQIDDGIDSGPIIAQLKEKIFKDDTAEVLTKRLFSLGSDLVLEALSQMDRGQVASVKQDDKVATKTTLVSKESGKIGWELSADRIGRMIRAYQPWPGAYSFWNGKMVKFLEAYPILGGSKSAGRVISVEGQRSSVGITTGQGILGIVRLQLEGGKILSSSQFMSGHKDFLGATLEAQGPPG